MTTVQNIHQNIAKASRALNTWSDSLCGDTVIGFTYNNEPKQGYTEV
jgi:aryl-phospho-beta-D-glucosidase BglC (GH1 family)